jgi:NitT/TauT family transport system substrate-binding protein
MWKASVLAVCVLLAATSSPAHARQVLRIGTNIWPGYEPLYLAAERGAWRSRFNVRLVEYPSATEVLRAFRNRALEAAALTLDEVLALQGAELPIKVVAVLDISAGGDVILARPAITDFHALAGRRIGVESGALGAYVISRALEIHGMSLADVEIVTMDVSAHENAYQGDLVDAVVTFEPVRTRLLAEGAREVFSSNQIPGEIVDVLVVHEAVLEREGDTVRQLVKGWFQTLDYMKSEPEAAARFTAHRLRITPEEVVSSYDGLYLPGAAENVALLSGALTPTLQRLHRVLLQQQILLAPVDYEGLIAPDWLAE